MCCSYGYDPELTEALRDRTERITPAAEKYGARDVRPSDPAVILLEDPADKTICADVMPWGFLTREKKLLINARAESALEKPLFSDSVRYRRCLIPASHFYEWDPQKVKYTFSLPGERLLFMAGFYNVFDAVDRFIILTTEANASMRPVHDRMPLILSETQIMDWLTDPACVRDLLQARPPELERNTEYEQLRFF